MAIAAAFVEAAKRAVAPAKYLFEAVGCITTAGTCQNWRIRWFTLLKRMGCHGPVIVKKICTAGDETAGASNAGSGGAGKRIGKTKLGKIRSA